MIKEKQIVIDGLLSTYAETGEGKHLLLLHGWGCSSQTFKNLQIELGKSYHVFAFDFPGFGKSDDPSADWGCENYAVWTEKMISKIGIKNPIVLGHSFGGRISLILNSKIAMSKLILTGSAGLILHSEKNKSKSKYSLVKNILRSVLPETTFESVKKAGIQLMGSPDYKNSNQTMREVLKKVIAEDLRSYAGKINIPTLLIWGENDQDTPVALGKLFNELISGSILHILKGCGHYVFIDNAAEFLRLSKEFIQDNQ